MGIVSKLPEVGVTIFSVMTQLANEHGATNLAQGFPDFDVHPELIRRVEVYMREGFNQYAPMPGVPSLRERIAEKTKKLYGADVDPHTDVTVTTGATEALFASITAVVNRNDEVVVFEPAYDSYVPVIRLNGGIPVFIKMIYPDYRIDWDEVKGAVTPRTRLMILNFPHNPTGRVLSAEDIAALSDIVENTGIWIISDEVYEHIIFDGLRHESILRYPALAARSFVISSFGKTYHATGWKIGYCIAPPELSREIQRIHQFVTFASITPVQMAFADILTRKDLYLELAPFYQRKRDLFLRLLADSRFKPLQCSGSYFQMLDYSEISNDPDTRFARELIAKHRVAAIPPSAFYHRGDDHRVLRFCFAKKDATLEKAAGILSRV